MTKVTVNWIITPSTLRIPGSPLVAQQVLVRHSHHVSHLPLELVEFARVHQGVGLVSKTIRGLCHPHYPRIGRGMRIEEPSEEG